jgi:hypothetical protein
VECRVTALFTVFFIGFIQRRRRWEDQTTRVREMKNAYKIVLENPEGKRKLRKLIRENAIILK